MPRTTLFVTAPEGEDGSPQRMRHASETLFACGGMFNVPPGNNGLPIPTEDGTYEVRIPGDSPMAVRVCRSVLTDHEGLLIVREESVA